MSDEERSVALLESLLAIDSPSGSEHRVAAHLAAHLEECGLEAYIDDAGNCIGRTAPRPGPVIMLLSHMDTVSGDVPTRREAGKLYGRGAVDAKGPLAAMARAVAQYPDFPGTLVVIGVVEEETPGSRGAVHIGRTLPCPDALIVGEPSGWDGVVLGYRGKIDLRYRVTRPPTHPTNPRQKASEAAVEFWSSVLELLGPPAGQVSFTAPGATLLSITADTVAAELAIDVRTPPGFDQQAFIEKLQEVAGDATLEIENRIDAVLADRRSAVVRALSAGIRLAGGTPRPQVRTATSDMNTLGELWRIPMATYGPGDSTLDHAADEHIVIGDYLRGIEVLGTALRHLASDPALAAAATDRSLSHLAKEF